MSSSQHTVNTAPALAKGDRALVAFDELRAAGIAPSTHTFNIAIAACGTEPGTRLQVG